MLRRRPRRVATMQRPLRSRRTFARPSRAFPAAGKQTKRLWLVITGVSAVIGLGYAAYVRNLSVIQILPVAAFVAAAIYLTDVRPKVKEIGKGGSSSSGPYGPW